MAPPHGCMMRCLELAVIEEDGLRVVEGPPDEPFMSNLDDAARVIEACLSTGAEAALLYASNLTGAFFDLSSGEAGAISAEVEKLRVRLAVVCAPGAVQASSRFGEMMAEERQRDEFGLVETRRAAREWLARC
jgi:hypothetical protein